MTQATTAEPVLSWAATTAAYDPVMGLEVHVELGTATKMFCGCATTFGAAPNTQVCPVCLGFAGVVPGRQRDRRRVGDPDQVALNCEIATWCRFAPEELLLSGHAQELPDQSV